MRKIQRISFIGAGNVASHLAIKLYQEGFEIVSVLSRGDSAQRLAAMVQSKAANTIRQFVKSKTDLIIIAINDDNIQPMAHSLSGKIDESTIVVHTSGATSSISDSKIVNTGVFYPLQSFRKNKPLDFTQIPFLITGNDQETESSLFQLANKLSKNIQVVSDQQRLALHVAAVFANNFTTEMYILAERICQEHSMDFKTLLPLIMETTSRMEDESPKNLMTGPAIRNDKKTIKKHQHLLTSSPEILKIYNNITKIIQNTVDENR